MRLDHTHPDVPPMTAIFLATSLFLLVVGFVIIVMLGGSCFFGTQGSVGWLACSM